MLENVKQVLVDALNIDEASITPEATLSDDLDIDSLSAVELALEWNSIINLKGGIDEITAFDTSDFRVKLAAEVKDLDMEAYFSKRDLKFNDRFTQFARIAAKQAMENVHFNDTSKVGVIIGSGIGGIDTISNAQVNLMERGPGRVSPFFIPMSLVNLAAGQVAIDFDLKGTCMSVVTACAAATNSIGEAFHKIKAGQLEACLAGGAEASISPVAVAGFMQMKALSTETDKNKASIPFDVNRSGFVMGEGAGILVLEELEHAKARNATILAEVVGYGSTCDAHHITAPAEDGSGAAHAMRLALKDAEIESHEIDYINAHGTSTPLNDKTETKAIHAIFNHDDLMVSSTKSFTGHILGASGAIEAIISVLALQNQLVPATFNTSEQDSECDLNISKNQNTPKDLKYVMSNSLGFGGHNASLIFKKWED